MAADGVNGGPERPRRGMIGCVLVLLGIAALGWFGSQWASDWWKRTFEPSAETIVSGSLEGLRAQNRLSAFVASYVATATTRISQFGLEARMTTIIPGMVRYEVNMARLRPQDVTWNAATGTLSVVLPPMEVERPQIDLNRIQKYDSGGLLIRYGDIRARLERSNQTKGQAELVRQARAATPMGLAKDATRRAIEQSFVLPLRAAGLPATVRVRFPDEPDFPAIDTTPMDRSRSLEDVYHAVR